MRPMEGDAIERLTRDAQDLANRHGVAYLVVRPYPKRVTGFVGNQPSAVREDQADADDRQNTVVRVEPAK